MFLSAALALAAAPPFAVGSDMTPFTLARPASGRVPDPVVYRVQQELTPARELGLVVLTQSDVRVAVVGTNADGSRVWRAEPMASVVDAWTDFGNVSAADLAGVPAPPVSRWTERADGTVVGTTLEGAPGSTASTLTSMITGLADQLRLPPPDRPVAVGGSWTRQRVFDVELPVDDRVLRVHFGIDATYTFRGWSVVEGRRTAFIEAELQLRGEGLILDADGATGVALWARTGAWSWVEPADGTLVYGLASAELSVAVGYSGYEPARDDVTRVRLSLARVDGG